MTWYDGGPAPDPARRERAERRRLRAVPPPDDARGDPWLEPGHPAPWTVPAAPGEGVPPPADPARVVTPPEAVPGPAAVPVVAGPEPAAVPVVGAPVAGADDGATEPAPGHEPSGRARLRAVAQTASAAAWALDPGPGPGPGRGQDGPPGSRPADGDDRPRLLDAVRWRLPARTALVAVAALALVGGAVALRAAAGPTGEPVTVEEPVVAPSASPQAEPTAEVDATVWVHVVGQVAAPGVVGLPAGSRVGEAVTAAGGALPDADLAGLNLAAVVQDGAQVRVPAPGEVPQPPPDDGGGAGGGSAAGGGTVDVNTAGAGELQALPGIGPVLADRIVAWRTEHGAFADVDALREVPGIGPAVLAQIRDLVRV